MIKLNTESATICCSDLVYFSTLTTNVYKILYATWWLNVMFRRIERYFTTPSCLFNLYVPFHGGFNLICDCFYFSLLLFGWINDALLWLLSWRRSDIALLYNDRNILENHHVSAVFRLIKEDEDCNILSSLKPNEYKSETFIHVLNYSCIKRIFYSCKCASIW